MVGKNFVVPYKCLNLPEEDDWGGTAFGEGLCCRLLSTEVQHWE
jgi:hypothetical protein